jgi:MFS family permease
VSGALLAGIFLSVLSVVMPNIFEKLGHDYPSLHWLFVTGLGNFTKFVGPALIGLGLGRNPNGVAQQVMDGFRPLRRAPAATAVWIAAIIAGWALSWRGIIGHWTFALLVVASVFVAPRIIMGVLPDRFTDVDDDPEADHPDLIGLTRPFLAADRDAFDRALALPARKTL